VGAGGVAGEFVGVVGSAREQDWSVSGTFGHENDRMKFNPLRMGIITSRRV
jgi:hypothetical protein